MLYVNNSSGYIHNENILGSVPIKDFLIKEYDVPKTKLSCACSVVTLVDDNNKPKKYKRLCSRCCGLNIIKSFLNFVENEQIVLHSKNLGIKNYEEEVCTKGPKDTSKQCHIIVTNYGRCLKIYGGFSQNPTSNSYYPGCTHYLPPKILVFDSDIDDAYQEFKFWIPPEYIKLLQTVNEFTFETIKQIRDIVTKAG